MSKLNASIIDDKEREALKIFREKIPDVLATLNEYFSHDQSLIRWLRARELDVSKAEEMIRKSMSWRAKENINSIFEWKIPEFLEQNYVWKVSGFDKDGDLVICAPFGLWDIRKAVSLDLKTDLLRHADLIFEHTMKFLQLKSTKEVMYTQFVVVVDFEGFSLRQLASKETIECILDVVRHFEDNHPETLKLACVVNAPKIFEILFALVKPLLTPRTVSKIKVHGSNPDQWRPFLLSNIEPDQLPSKFGGSNTSCRDYKGVLGYNIFSVLEVFPENEFISVTVEAGTKHTVPFSLSKSSKLSWNFRTVDYDIGFALKFSGSSKMVEANNDVSEVLFDCSRADSHLHLQKGAFVAEKPGDLYLLLDETCISLNRIPWGDYEMSIKTNFAIQSGDFHYSFCTKRTPQRSDILPLSGLHFLLNSQAFVCKNLQKEL